MNRMKKAPWWYVGKFVKCVWCISTIHMLCDWKIYVGKKRRVFFCFNFSSKFLLHTKHIKTLTFKSNAFIKTNKVNFCYNMNVCIFARNGNHYNNGMWQCDIIYLKLNCWSVSCDAMWIKQQNTYQNFGLTDNLWIHWLFLLFIQTSYTFLLTPHSSGPFIIMQSLK